VVTAAAVTTIARVSGGRFRVCFGPGFTARSAPVRPSALVDYVAVLRKLLAGRLTIVDGRPVTMPGRVEVPLWLGVESRRDAIAAVRVADGIVGLSYPGLPAATVLSGATVPCPPAGFQEAVYLPAGMDLSGELRSFASLTTLRSENTILKLRE
jgi:hypothetical protein